MIFVIIKFLELKVQIIEHILDPVDFKWINFWATINYFVFHCCFVVTGCVLLLLIIKIMIIALPVGYFT